MPGYPTLRDGDLWMSTEQQIVELLATLAVWGKLDILSQGCAPRSEMTVWDFVDGPIHRPSASVGARENVIVIHG